MHPARLSLAGNRASTAVLLAAFSVVGADLSVVQGSCSLVNASCVESPNFPQPYGNDERCEIKSTGYMLSITDFSVAEGNYLIIAGIALTNSTPPSNQSFNPTTPGDASLIWWNAFPNSTTCESGNTSCAARTTAPLSSWA